MENMQIYAEMIAEVLPEGWTVKDAHMSPDCLLECQHGATVELDGRCPEGCVSPLPEMGLV